ncbi:hypothetical protein CCL45_gp41 [Sulfolobus islandicus rod-shaped virus 5]|uniref:Uncharacterized protein n=2 Tax=Usarudivirus SIRV5 TaxID=2846591 RepID=A0A1X9SKM4_9VIRU|nr:hypothetical protein CCL43_gp39 [Sulfolobus islandicus rod-shaped virus 7]YP_009362651.1 hypothetical protein CCL45_gp41 [Sulfolobus islandicus rod-shaped virus 5]YP_009362902.1 hypothetical protein CCL44_gp40 [Sulfolobus islandicus rod-shaped phage 6]ARQ96609.1 hypothetical protein [Sulfolobus islandicus rod-shaped virus 7]ARQ96663.1 hypothetical protein [Sulfolobus islandicus rod-shaped virus 5]ARQ96769.1 hypothetical protein [Sulfolobus islandicus rod-shaped phage 6]
MSSTYCVQLPENLLLLSMTTVNPINFTSLQFSLSVNSLVIFLFSKYPFNSGYYNNFCINQDEFGFAQVGQSFNINLSNYQGYYMLMLIYPQGINLKSSKSCVPIQGLTMTFQNTTISPITSEIVINNFDGQEETGFCSCYDGQSHVIEILCNNSNYVSAISLNNLNNQLLMMTCQGFVYENDTTVGFIAPSTCGTFGSYLTAEITFIANQSVIDFLNNNGISYNILSSTECQPTYKLLPCTLPCKSFYQITKLLSPPAKYSIISSKLWNEIVQDLYLTYSVFKYINYLTQYAYLDYIYPTILDFYNFYENFQPYPFTQLLYAQKGIPLTVNDFNKLIDAIVKLANENNIKLKKGLSYVQRDQVVRASQFTNIVYNVNQFLTFNYNQYFLLDCNGSIFSNLLNKQNAFLNVIINNLVASLNIPSNVYIKNLLIYTSNQTIYNYGVINKLIININNGEIYLNENSFINFLLITDNNNNIYVNDNSVINNLICISNTGTINISQNAIIKNNQCA